MPGVQRFADADVMMFVGNNPGVSAFSRDGGPPYANAFKHLRDAKRRGMKLIAIDPRRTELARSADVHLQVKPGEDPTLLAGMVRVRAGVFSNRPSRCGCSRRVRSGRRPA